MSEKKPLDYEIKNAKERIHRRGKNALPKVYNLIKDYDKFNIEPPKGNPIGTCRTCGKKFEQVFSEDRNAYSSYRTCPECRKKRSKKLEKEAKKNGKEIAVATLPYQPYEWQKVAAEAFEEHMFVVLACGNRCGKDRFTIMTAIKYFVECLNENRLVDNPDMVPPVLWWQLAPTEKMAKQNWRELKQYFPKEWVVAVSDSNFQMETIGGGIIEVRSGYDPESLTGVGLDLVTITEAARFKDLAASWANIEARLSSPGRGRKIDRKGKKYGMGKAIINSSPLGKNDFYKLFCYGQKDHVDYSSYWWSAQYPWTANPSNKEKAETIVHTKYGDLTYEETLRRQIGDRTYRSNYLAEFVAYDGTVFKNFEEKCVINIYDQEKTGAKTPKERNEFIKQWKSPIFGETYIGGYDPATGSSNDSPIFIIRHKETGRVVQVYDLYGKGYSEQYDFIAEICKMYNYAELHWLRTGHTAIEGEFSKRGIIDVPLDEQGHNKARLVNTLELAIENGDLHVLYDGSEEIQTLIYEMNDYTEKKGKYSNDKMPHDDYVSALYAAFSDYSVKDTPIYYCGLMEGLY